MQRRTVLVANVMDCSLTQNRFIFLHPKVIFTPCYFRKALDHIDLNLVSHRYVSGVLKDDHLISFPLARAPLASDRSLRGLFQPLNGQ